MSWLGRAAARLVPAERRDWAEALWAEAGEVPPGLARLAWRAGGMRLIAREALLVRRAGRSLVFATAAAWVTWAAWPGPAGNIATAVARVDVVTVLLVLAGLPLLARWLFGPPAAGPVARVLRVGAYAAVLVLTVAKASVEQVVNAPPVVARQAATGRGLQPPAFTWFAETIFLLIVAGYVAAILVMTARRTRVAPATLALGTGAGILLGRVMCAVAPLGLAKDATEPWLAGSAIDPVVALAWILLLGGLLRWLYPGQHLSAAVAYNRELTASTNAKGYFLILLAFPIIGLILGAPASSWTHILPPGDPGSPPGGGGPPNLEPAPDPPGGGQASLPAGTRQVTHGAPRHGALSGYDPTDRIRSA